MCPKDLLQQQYWWADFASRILDWYRKVLGLVLYGCLGGVGKTSQIDRLDHINQSSKHDRKEDYLLLKPTNPSPARVG